MRLQINNLTQIFYEILNSNFHHMYYKEKNHEETTEVSQSKNVCTYCQPGNSVWFSASVLSEAKGPWEVTPALEEAFQARSLEQIIYHLYLNFTEENGTTRRPQEQLRLTVATITSLYNVLWKVSLHLALPLFAEN